jgi:hypothetical protein
MGDQPDVKPLPTQDNTLPKIADTHPLPDRDSNSRSQFSSGRRHYMHQTAMPYRPATNRIFVAIWFYSNTDFHCAKLTENYFIIYKYVTMYKYFLWQC